MHEAGRVGDEAECPNDAHGSPDCPHRVIGPAVTGSPDVVINDMPAVRVGDAGVHSACCGANTWHAKTGATTVFINGIPAHRKEDTTEHCGGVGSLIEGSEDVLIGDGNGNGNGPVANYDEGFIVLDRDGDPVPNRRYLITVADGRKVNGRTDDQGRTVIIFTDEPEEVMIEIFPEDETAEEDW